MGEAALVTAPDAVVRVAGFGKRYGGAWVARDVSLHVRRGEIYGVIGPDGAGKSSLLKAIAGVLAHDAGTIDVLGTRVDSARAAERAKARLGFMPQGLGLNLYAELSVEENVDFFARLRLVPRAALAERKRRLLALTRLDAAAARPVKHLSGGMKQKLGLVCTLVHEPELLILDEPTTGVDPLSRRDFWEILGRMARERGITAIVSTSYMDEVTRFDRVAVLHHGALVTEGTPAAIGALDDGRAPRPAPALASAPVVVEARSLVRDFGGVRAVDGVSLTVRAGEIVGLLGANGAGKTTVLKMLTGLIAPTGGVARVTGHDMRHAARAVRSRIGYMSQAFSLYTDLTVRENVALAAGVYGLDRRAARDRAAWVMAMAGLEGRESTLAGRLPVGMRQRLALGCALVHRPEVLFLDEPTSGVDPAGRRRFWEIIASLARDDGVAVVLSTHYMTEAEHCDRVALLSAGRVVADAPPAALRGQVARETGRPATMDDVFVARVTALERAS